MVNHRHPHADDDDHYQQHHDWNPIALQAEFVVVFLLLVNR
jgi:hypothetical protein